MKVSNNEYDASAIELPCAKLEIEGLLNLQNVRISLECKAKSFQEARKGVTNLLEEVMHRFMVTLPPEEKNSYTG